MRSVRPCDKRRGQSKSSNLPWRESNGNSSDGCSLAGSGLLTIAHRGAINERGLVKETPPRVCRSGVSSYGRDRSLGVDHRDDHVGTWIDNHDLILDDDILVAAIGGNKRHDFSRKVEEPYR